MGEKFLHMIRVDDTLNVCWQQLIVRISSSTDTFSYKLIVSIIHAPDTQNEISGSSLIEQYLMNSGFQNLSRKKETLSEKNQVAHIYLAQTPLAKSIALVDTRRQPPVPNNCFLFS